MVAFSNLLNNGLLLASQNVFHGLASPEQASLDQYNVINFLGGSAPYKQNPGFGISTDIPDQCTVEQVQLLSRHGERYPSVGSGARLEKIMRKFEAHNGTFHGPLSFLNDYTYFVSDPSLYEKETTPFNSEGFFAGTSTAERHGMYFRSKYKSLYTSNSSHPSLVVFTTNSGRVHLTAKNFARGFLQDQYSDANVKYVILEEDSKMGANSLTPSYACRPYLDDDSPDDIVDQYDDSYLGQIRQRLLKDNQGLSLSESDVERLFLWCAYEINVRGLSPFCSLFTNEEYIRYSYLVDLDAYYNNGPGSKYTKGVGASYWQLSLRYLQQKSPLQKVLLSFTHDTDIEIFLASIGLTDAAPLPTSHVAFPNPYVHLSIVPQGARVYLEKYLCGNETYVRFILNDAVVPLKNCSSGPGFSCLLKDYALYVQQRFSNALYTLVCHPRALEPAELTFFWDYGTRNYTAPDFNG